MGCNILLEMLSDKREIIRNGDSYVFPFLLLAFFFNRVDSWILMALQKNL